MSRTRHPRLRSDSFLSRYSYRRHGTRLEQYDIPVPRCFLLPGNAKVRLKWPYHVTIRYKSPDMWARWVTVARPGRGFMGPAAIKRSNMKSRRRLEDPTLERRDRVEYLERKRSEEPWHREDREYFRGVDGAHRCRWDLEDRDDSDDFDCWDDDDRGWDEDRPQSDSEVVEECAARILWIADREGSSLAQPLRAMLLQLERELEEYKPPADRPLRQSLIHEARGAIGRDRVWHAWRMNRIDWLAGLPGEVKLWAEARDGEGGMLTLIRRKQMFPSRTRRFCTEQLKLVPLKAHMSRLADDKPVINAIGIRAAESQARSMLEEWEWNDDFDCWTWRPLISWSEQDVIDIHTRNGLAPNPLYLRGAGRVGCYPCIYARKSEIAALPQAVVDRLSPLEHELTADAVARGVARPERAFFHLHDPANHASGFMPIERVREWARSDRGGRQMLLLDAPSEPGCVRWGLCEHLPAERQEGDQ